MGPLIWNDIPEDIQEAGTILTFKKHLKAHIFNQYRGDTEGNINDSNNDINRNRNNSGNNSNSGTRNNNYQNINNNQRWRQNINQPFFSRWNQSDP